jgi:HPt (histidine-containing phosphotransfer) domain-containing protein
MTPASPGHEADSGSPKRSSTEPLVSDLASDPDMVDLVEMFVDEMPERVSTIEEAVRNTDRELLTSLSHQLKGSAGGYGFSTITEAAGEVEKLAKTEQDLSEIEGAITELLSLCRRASAKKD